MMVHHFTFWLFFPALFVFEIEEVEAGTFHRVFRYPYAGRLTETEELTTQLQTGTILTNTIPYKLIHYKDPEATKHCKGFGEAGHEHYVQLLFNDHPLDDFCATDPLNADGFKEVAHCYIKMGKRTDRLIIQINQQNASNCYHVLYEIYYEEYQKENIDKINAQKLNCDGELNTWRKIHRGWVC